MTKKSKISNNKPISASSSRWEDAEKQVRQIQKEIRFDMRDFPVETIVARFNSGNFHIPGYQREFVWGPKDQSYYIESVIIGLPIPMMFLVEDEQSLFEIVDGAQRIQSLDAFLSGDLVLTDLEKLDKLNGFRFGDLSTAQQNKLKSRALRIVVLDSDTTPENRRDLFNRINKSGKPLVSSERRRGALEGKFMTFLQNCADNELFINVCRFSETTKKRKEPLELATRFFAYSESYLDFKHDVDSFLDKFIKKHREVFDEARYQTEFDRTMSFVQKFFPYGFAKSESATTTPRVRFEAISVGVNLALRKNPSLIPEPVIKWLESDDFRIHTTTHASNSAPRLRNRIEFVRDSLLKG